MARTAYKALYLHQLQAAGENLDRAKRAERELARVRAALAPYGEGILSHFQAPTKENELADIAIGLPPHEYVAAEAFFLAGERLMSPHDIGSWTQLIWRGRRVMQL
jgi:hypothetical protein